MAAFSPPVGKHPAQIFVMAGQFQSQPMVFVHLLDVAPDLNLDHIDVICGGDPSKRLGHYFDPDTPALIRDQMGDMNTVILFLPGAGAFPDGSDLLKSLGTWAGHRHLPENG
jgi:hypothetical protein